MNAALRPEELFDFSSPNYNVILQARLDRLRRLRANPSQLSDLRAYYREHIADWICDWCMTYDPRRVSQGAPSDLPFVLFAKQREWVEFTFKNWRDGKYGGTEKSRDVGLSWLAIAVSVALCTLYDRVAVGLGSFKQEKVDWLGEMGSLFEKARYLIKNLPPEFRGGYQAATCSTERKLLFPATGGSIIGEIGDNVGRGGRTSIYFVDEAAYFEHDTIVDMALSKNTPCRQDLSSVRGMDNSFSQRMHDGHSRKFTFHWRDNPFFTQGDYDEFLKQWGPVVTAQELDIDYQTSVEGLVLPNAWIQAAVGAEQKLGYKASGAKRLGLDVADEGSNRCAVAGRHGSLLNHLESWSGIDSDTFKTAVRAVSICEGKYDGIDYDADGLGAFVRGDVNRINEDRVDEGKGPILIEPFRGSASGDNLYDADGEMVEGRINRDYFANLKAQSWWALRIRFQNTYRAVIEGQPFDGDNIICIPKDLPERANLLLQLSQPVYSINTAGKVTIDKTPDGSKSPDLADAVMIAFNPLAGALGIWAKLGAAR